MGALISILTGPHGELTAKNGVLSGVLDLREQMPLPGPERLRTWPVLSPLPPAYLEGVEDDPRGTRDVQWPRGMDSPGLNARGSVSLPSEEHGKELEPGRLFQHHLSPREFSITLLRCSYSSGLELLGLWLGFSPLIPPGPGDRGHIARLIAAMEASVRGSQGFCLGNREWDIWRVPRSSEERSRGLS